MKINANTVGNYGPAYVNNSKPKFKVEDNLNVAKQEALKQNSAVDTFEGSTQEVSNEEKKYFMNLYPENTKEIMDYHFYERSGKLSGVSVGSLLDKRG